MSTATLDPATERVIEIQAARDAKLAIVLLGRHPAWIVDEQVSLAQNECVFDVVFRYDRCWVRRRYTYDAEVDVLHMRGEMPFDEAQLHTLPRAALVQVPA